MRCGSVTSRAALFFLLAGSLTQGVGGDACWPQFRGPNGSGGGPGRFPIGFGPATNCLWSVVLPEGHSSPCLWGDVVFVTGYESNRLWTLALDRRTGAERWRRWLPGATIERGAHLSSPATATPATDGHRVYVYFGAFGLAAYAVSGEEAWRKPLPVPVTQHGAGTSPVVAGDRLILTCDQDTESYVMAVRRETGETLWRTERPGFKRGFATPLLYPAERPEQVIIPGTLRLVSYNLSDGSERWSVSGLPNEMVSSAVAGEGLIFIAGWTHGSGVRRMPPFAALLQAGDADHDGRLTRDETPAGPAKQHFLYIDANKDGHATRDEYETIAQVFDRSRNVALAVRPDGQGDVTGTHVLWEHLRGLPYVPTPLYYEGRLYLVKNGGLATCLEARTGRVLYQEERLGALGDYYASPVVAAGSIVAVSQAGTAVVYRAGDTLEVLSRNPLGEAVIATPALAAGCLYVRTARHLYAFGSTL